jgi:hypothetical protein
MLPTWMTGLGPLLRWNVRSSREGPRPRVAHTLSFMYAPHEHAQHLCHRVLYMTCPGFLTVADTKGYVGATPE